LNFVSIKNEQLEKDTQIHKTHETYIFPFVSESSCCISLTWSRAHWYQYQPYNSTRSSTQSSRSYTDGTLTSQNKAVQHICPPVVPSCITCYKIFL